MIAAAAHFSGEPSMRWSTDPNAPDRMMVLLDDFWFRDRDGRKWDSPACLVTDGASIPRPLWSLVGSPFTGDYRRAALVHDQACKVAGTDHVERRAADRMFYRACRAGGCSIRDAIILYIGVRIGSSWHHVPQWAAATDDDRPRLRRSSADEMIERDFASAADEVLASGETDDDIEIERRTDAALLQQTGMDFARI